MGRASVWNCEEAGMIRLKHRTNLVLDIICIIGCEACAIQYLCQGLVGVKPSLSGLLWVLLGLGWMACSAVWIAHLQRLLEKSPLEG